MSTVDDAPTVISSRDEELRSDPLAEAADQRDLELTRVDRYLLLHSLGRGAFGLVRAAYDPELDRKVAIKLLRPGAVGSEGDTPSGGPRSLLEEARMAAKLAHPNVVAVHDVGSLRADDGSSDRGIYIVMEHLAGPALLDWIADRQHPRTWKEVLAVMLAAGEGLAAAHAVGMVHRDFKPQNLRFGDDGRIRVLDFGLASLVAQLQREVDTIAGTPPYIAPEMHVGRPADARTDQYAFCVATWRCLYGKVPYEGASLLSLAAAKRHRVVVPHDTHVPAWVGARLARGLEPEPDARYPDMRALLVALAEDPQAKRRRWIASAAITTALVGAGYGIAQRERADDPCALPEGHFDGIWDDEVRARVTASFDRPGHGFADAALAEIDAGIAAYLESWTKTRTEVCLASLDRKERSIDAASGELECLDRQLRRVAALGSSFGQADDAVMLHAADLVARLPPPANCRRPPPGAATERVARDVALALEERIADAETLARVGRFADGLARIDEILVEAEAAADRTSLLHARLTETQAALDDRKFDRARSAAIAAHQLAVELGDPSAATRAMVMLVANQRAQGNYAEAELLAALAAGQVAQASPSVQVDLAFQRGALAVDRGQFDDAFARLAEARALAESLYGEDHLQVADIVLLQGIAQSSSRRDFDAALAHFGHAAEIYRAHYGEQHPRVASIHNNIGGVHFRRAEWKLAIPEFERSLAIYTAIHGDDHPLTMRALSNLGAAEYQSGNRERAIGLLERALAARERALGRDHPEHISAEANLALMLLYGGDPRRALVMTTHVYERTAAMHGEHATESLTAAATVAEIATQLDEDGVRSRFDAIVRAGVAKVSPDDRVYAGLVELAAMAAGRASDASAAIELGERRIALVEGAAERAKATAIVADALLSLGRPAEAKQRLVQLLGPTESRAKLPVELLFSLGRAELALSNRDGARAAYEEVLARLADDPARAARHAEAHFELARLADDPATRRRHADECVRLLAPTGLSPKRLAAARAMSATPP